jgi:hypothetical protein
VYCENDTGWLVSLNDFIWGVRSRFTRSGERPIRRTSDATRAMSVFLYLMPRPIMPKYPTTPRRAAANAKPSTEAALGWSMMTSPCFWVDA